MESKDELSLGDADRWCSSCGNLLNPGESDPCIDCQIAKENEDGR